MTKFETILRLSEIKGFMIMAGDIPLEINDSDMIYAETLSAIDNLIDDLSEGFQENLSDKNSPGYSIEKEENGLKSYCMHCHRE